jgi:hypothetical protein
MMKEVSKERTNHSFETNDIDKPIHDLCQRFRDDPGFPYDDDFPIHTFFPLATLPLHRWNSTTRFTPVIDVRFRAREDLGTEFESEGRESSLDVCKESVEKQDEEGQDEEGEQREGTELEVTRKQKENKTPLSAMIWMRNDEARFRTHPSRT